MTRSISLSVLVGAFLIGSASAKNIDLSTVPDRHKVQLTIYNSEDLTLVRRRARSASKRVSTVCSSAGPTP